MIYNRVELTEEAVVKAYNNLTYPRGDLKMQ
jgi:hypothetical protein